jgi:pyridoxamine 5'-phosphate oxidase
MTPKEIIEFINKNQTCCIATIEGNKPRVRGVMTYRADDKGIIFHTGVTKDFYKQLQANPNVELCFDNNDPQNFIQVRVSGIAIPENDVKLKEEIVASRPFLKPVVEKFGYQALAVFRVQQLTATVWTMATNFAPKVFIELK